MQTPVNEWLDVVSARLQRQWPSIDAMRLDDVAVDLWRDERLRTMPPDEAAEAWLSPVAGKTVRIDRPDSLAA